MNSDRKYVTVQAVFPASDGAKTPFGKRWGGQTVELAAEDVKSLLEGRILAVDVMEEYVVFLKIKESRENRP